MNNRTDEDWIRLLKDEDSEARAELWEKLFAWSIIGARKRGQSDDLGRDAAMDAFIRIQKRGVYNFSYQGPFLDYCRVIVVNRVLSLIKKRRRDPIASGVPVEAIRQTGKEDPNPIAAPALIQERLQPCLDKLSEREQTAIQQFYFEGQSPQEIAESLDITRNYVHLILHRSRHRLRACLQKRGYETGDDLLSL